ncbi:hypothetical protein IAR55_001927 [Kwoniella newhampshirensis]|uniref:Phospholipase A-2-activating protein n=1 Tax=Kwoniella newhampshirensis TaxID=1651941 RepID=A0AAW0Z3I5_9TREE
MTQSPPYQLAFSLHGHASDVRNLCAPSPHIPLLLSASRDGSAIVWGPSSKSREWDVKLRVEGPEKRYVSCVGMARWNGEAFLLVGSSSGILATYTLPSPTAPPPPPDGVLQEPFHTLIEHRQNLCCLDTSKGGLIATGSWDKTVIIWKEFKKVFQIEGHEQAIWAVKFIGEDRLLTASADKKIILHSLDVASGRSTPMQEYTGHTEPVRGLSLRPDGKGFWSCANDGLVNIYVFDKSAPIQSLSGHTSFVYSIAALPDGSGAISTGEDGTMRVWSDTELVQTVPHTSNSLWSCAYVPSVDGSGSYIASSSSDSTIRFFTRSESLMAPISEREDWDKEVSGRQLDKSQVGDVKQSDLPGIEALGREGKKDGQVLMIKNNGVVEAYQWSQPTSTWQQIGQVVDAIGSGRKQLYEGQEYDFVFDVDVSEGMPPLKLPYNVAENPWIAAQRFLNKHELPQTYCEQVVEFIQKNSGGAQLGTRPDTSTYVDPYTGGSRYTGASSSNSGPTYGGGDPFTGGSAYSSTPAPKPKPKGVLPVKTYLSFKQINITAAKVKISQLNEEIKSASPDLAFTTEEEKNMMEIYGLLSLPAVAQPSADAQDGKEKFDPKVLLGLITRWPEDKRFPLIDLARCLAAISPRFGSTSSAPGALVESCSLDQPWQSSKPRETNTLLALRGLANLFVTATGRGTMGGEDVVESILGALNGLEWAAMGARKIVVATISLNYSILAIQEGFPVSQSSKLSGLILHIVDNEKEDAEVIYRSAVALGNLLLVSSIAGTLQVGEIARGKRSISEFAKKKSEKRLLDLAEEIEGLGL